MKYLSFSIFFILATSTLLVGQISKPEYIHRWVDSLNNLSPYTWTKLAKSDSLRLLELTYAEIDFNFSKLAQLMRELEVAPRLQDEKQIMRNEFYDKVVSPSLKKCKTKEERDALIFQYPEYFGSQTRERLGITEEMVEQRRQERIKLQKEQKYE